MAVIQKSSQPFEPYARLMNVIGDQLITDKKVAVIEIIKNAYDADAENVQVRFFNLKNWHNRDILPLEEQPYIEIEDDGEGMTLDIIQKVWLRPATPYKYGKKQRKDDLTKKGRIIQGEKGIGRFAIHKLGELIEVFSKAKGKNEVKLEMNFSEYDPERANLFNQQEDFKLLNKVMNTWYVNEPAEVITKEHGTVIKIFKLRDHWKKNDLEELYKAVQRLKPPIDENAKKLGIKFHSDFNVELFLNQSLYTSEEVTTFKTVIERAQYTMIGSVSDSGELSFTYKCTAPKREILDLKVNLLEKDDLSKFQYDPKSIKQWKKINGPDARPKCGSFKFSFYAYDLKNKDKTILTKEIESFIKDNFVFLYRDGVRVYPYGEKGQDWLNLDKLRATVRAANFISYNDLTGFVYITQEENEKLKDSTNRQGIMDIEGAFFDFTTLVTAVTEIFNTEIKLDKIKLESRRRGHFKDSSALITKSYSDLEKTLEKTNNLEVLEKAKKFLNLIRDHNLIMKDRMQTVEDLAGLGMAVEKASHDALMLLSRMRGNLLDFKKKLEKEQVKTSDIRQLIDELDQNLDIIYDEMQVIQPLFKIQRKSIQSVSLKDSIDKVLKYFRRDLTGKISIEVTGKDFSINTNSGLILQVLINLIDNAIYWVNTKEDLERKIIIKLIPNESSFIISDSGPGIREESAPFVFNEFFSLKADGRGLGLYIVKEILLRINGEISVITSDSRKILQGANFYVKLDSNI